MDIFQIVFGRFFVELIGAFLRYIFVNFILKVKGDALIPFSKFWTPNESEYKKLETEAANRIAAIIALIIFLIMIYHLG